MLMIDVCYWKADIVSAGVKHYISIIFISLKDIFNHSPSTNVIDFIKSVINDNSNRKY